MTRQHNEVGSDEAADALASVDASRAEIADRLVTPAWYHPTLGVLVGAVLLSAETHSLAVFIGALVVQALGCGVLVGSYRRLTGIWVSGLRRGPAGRVSVALVASLYAVGGLAALLDFGLGVRGAFAAAGVMSFALVVVLGRRFDDALRAELRAEVRAGE